MATHGAISSEDTGRAFIRSADWGNLFYIRGSPMN